MGKFIKKEVLGRFIEGLLKKYEVIAPVRKQHSVFFDKITNAKEIVLDDHTDYPPKKFFLPSKEEIFVFDGKKITESVDSKKRIIFGIRKCDIDALAVLDKVFLEEPVDKLYGRKRKNNLIIGLACKEPFHSCFCVDALPTGRFDIMLMEVKGGYYAEHGSNEGRKLLKGFEDKNGKIVYAKCTDRIKEKDLMPYFNSNVWEEYGKKCLSCGACTVVCPTCGCFEIADEFNLDVKSGSRKKKESSCMLPSFTRIAGDFVFRKERVARYKHRMYHKLQYFRDRYGINMCTGCGRCKASCPVNICNMPKIVKELK